jgi:hypothetical protein
MRTQDMAAGQGGVFVAQERPWYVEDFINNPMQVLT